MVVGSKRLDLCGCSAAFRAEADKRVGGINGLKEAQAERRAISGLNPTFRRQTDDVTRAADTR